MKKGKTVKGSTLLEVVIAMIIISMLVGIVLQAKSMFSNQSNKIEQIDKLGAEWCSFTLLLEKDFYQSSEVYWEEDENSLSCTRKNKEIISYYFYENNIIRKQLSLSDTFNINTENYIINGYSNESSFIVPNKISFNIIYNEMNIPLILNKEISVENKLKYPDNKLLAFEKPTKKD